MEDRLRFSREELVKDLAYNPATGEPLYNKYFPWPGQHLPWWNLPTVDITGAIVNKTPHIDLALSQVQNSCIKQVEVDGVSTIRLAYRLQQYRRFTLLAWISSGSTIKSVVDGFVDELITGADRVLGQIETLSDRCGVLGFSGPPLSYTCPVWTRTSAGASLEFSVLSYPILDIKDFGVALKSFDFLLPSEMSRKDGLKYASSTFVR